MLPQVTSTWTSCQIQSKCSVMKWWLGSLAQSSPAWLSVHILIGLDAYIGFLWSLEKCNKLLDDWAANPCFTLFYVTSLVTLLVDDLWSLVTHQLASQLTVSWSLPLLRYRPIPRVFLIYRIMHFTAIRSISHEFPHDRSNSLRIIKVVQILFHGCWGLGQVAILHPEDFVNLLNLGENVTIPVDWL